MSDEADLTSSIGDAIKNTHYLLKTDPILAVEQASEILKIFPKYTPAQLLLATAHRHCGKLNEALELTENVLLEQPNMVAAHYEYAQLMGEMRRGGDAIMSLRKVLDLVPDHPNAWRLLADHLVASGDSVGGDEAYNRHIKSSVTDLSLREAASAMVSDQIPKAESILKEYLKTAPTDIAAIRMLAEEAVRCGKNNEAERLLQRCLELAPSFMAARFYYATLMHRMNKSVSALREIEILLDQSPNNPSYRNLLAVILSRVGDYNRSSETYDQLLKEYPDNAKIWLSYGHVLKTQGRQEDCIRAYRNSIDRNPKFGEAYWSLANLKIFRFSQKDFTEMHTQLKCDDLEHEDRVQFEFALGKAAEDARDYDASFKHYYSGNKLHKSRIRYDAQGNHTRVNRIKSGFDADFFHRRRGVGCASAAPIFIVGMPRSGSTLLEQILASHSMVEGTTELPDMISMALDLAGESGVGEFESYSSVLAQKTDAELRELGNQYIERTRVHRKTDKPFFIDKMPNNFLHIGLIHLILPNSKIIDARRHPLGCCLSNFKQYYARGQNFSYDLTDIGQFYSDYVDLMAHYDNVLPKRIFRVFYENTVADTESQVRKLLAHCNLQFEPACLRFFETKRGVRTASSEQVRQPIYRQGTEQWTNYDTWLDPLKSALGSVLKSYPDVPSEILDLGSQSS